MFTLVTMNEYLQYSYQSAKYDAITILVISNELFGGLLTEALKRIHEEGPNIHIYKLHLVKCERILDILRLKKDVNADYVIFVLDTRNKLGIQEVEGNIELLQRTYVCGRMCIINANSNLPLYELNIPIASINALRRKYKMPLLNGNITDTNGCYRIATRLTKLVLDSLGYQQRTPFIPWSLRNEN